MLHAARCAGMHALNVLAMLLEFCLDRLLVDPHRLRKIYLKQFAAFQEELSRRCGGIGVDLVQMTTADPYQKALGAFLDSRSRSRKKK